MAVQPRRERIDIRVTKEEKELIEKAAAAACLSVSSYIISTVVKQAKIDLAENEIIHLTREEALRFYELINNPPEPNENLKKLLNGINIDKEDK